MLFGLFNIPASFQGYINKIFAKNPDFLVIIYLNTFLSISNIWARVIKKL